MSETTLSETCACGGRLDVTTSVLTAARDMQAAFHEQHRGCAPIPPGPCNHNPGFPGPSGAPFVCELLAGHAGAHTTDRGTWGGTAVWDNEPTATEPPPGRPDDTAEKALEEETADG